MRVTLPLLAACAFCVMLPEIGQAKEAFEGIWAKSRAECRATDLPTSRTYVNLTKRETGPILDQYENHCRVGQVRREGEAFKLSLTCYEFWDDFRRRRSGRRISALVRVTGPKGLSINGEAYRRCPS